MSEPEGRGAASEGGWEGGRGARNERRGKAVPVKGAGEASGKHSVKTVREPGRLVVCSPLRIEARAMRRGLGDAAEVRHSGYGTTRATAQADRLRGVPFAAMAVGGTGASESGAFIFGGDMRYPPPQAQVSIQLSSVLHQNVPANP